MGAGTFTLYRNTHGKAVLWLAVILAIGAALATYWKQQDRASSCPSQPQLLGRFVVTPESARFIVLPTEAPLLARRHGVKCG